MGARHCDLFINCELQRRESLKYFRGFENLGARVTAHGVQGMRLMRSSAGHTMEQNPFVKRQLASRS